MKQQGLGGSRWAARLGRQRERRSWTHLPRNCTAVTGASWSEKVTKQNPLDSVHTLTCGKSGVVSSHAGGAGRPTTMRTGACQATGQAATPSPHTHAFSQSALPHTKQAPPRPHPARAPHTLASSAAVAR